MWSFSRPWRNGHLRLVERLHVAVTSMPTVGITQTGGPGSYTYSACKPGCLEHVRDELPEPLPVCFGRASERPLCWSPGTTQSGSPTGSQWATELSAGKSGEEAGSTESGRLQLNGATSQSQLMAVTRLGGATYFMPSENEWYKAAYLQPRHTSTYWAYATQSNSGPSTGSATGTNKANYYTWPVFDRCDESTLSRIGVFAHRPAPSGPLTWVATCCSGMNSNIPLELRGMEGGDWAALHRLSSLLQRRPADGRELRRGLPRGEHPTGWVPEPCAITLLLAPAACLLLSPGDSGE